MMAQPRKMSEIMQEMLGRLFRNPGAVPSSEAAHVALMFANVAWNESVGLCQPRAGYRPAWEMIEAENPEMWGEFKSNDVDAMIDELVRFKRQNSHRAGQRPHPRRSHSPVSTTSTRLQPGRQSERTVDRPLRLLVLS